MYFKKPRLNSWILVRFPNPLAPDILIHVSWGTWLLPLCIKVKENTLASYRVAAIALLSLFFRTYVLIPVLLIVVFNTVSFKVTYANKIS